MAQASAPARPLGEAGHSTWHRTCEARSMHLPSSFAARRHRAVAPALLFLAACTPVGDSAVRGELGRGTFQYTCDSSTRDCADGIAVDFPTRVAVGTRFGLSYEPFEGTARLDALEPSSPDLLEVRDYAWRALRPGTVGLMSRPPQGELHDYTFVKLEQAAGVRFFTAPAGQGGTGTDAADPSTRSVAWHQLGDELVLGSQSTVALVAEPEGADGAALAGEPLLDFECDEPGIVNLIRPARRPAYFYLAAAGTGAVRCTLEALGAMQRVDITIEPDPYEEPEPDAGSSADAGIAADAEVRP